MNTINSSAVITSITMRTALMTTGDNFTATPSPSRRAGRVAGASYLP
jgi:hypothetical protein